MELVPSASLGAPAQRHGTQALPVAWGDGLGEELRESRAAAPRDLLCTVVRGESDNGGVTV